MKRFLNQAWQEEDGVLTFEWVMILTLVVIGVVGGLAAARDGIIDELGDIAQATISFDQSFSLPGLDLNNDSDFDDPGEYPPSSYTDIAAEFVDCARGTFTAQPDEDDGPE